MQVVSVGILRGYNDTRAILCVTLISYWVFALPVGYTLGRTHLWGDPLGPQGFWTAFIVGVSIAAVLLVIRVRVLERRLLSGFDPDQGHGRVKEIGEGKGKLSEESFPFPSPNPSLFPSKTFGWRGGRAAGVRSCGGFG